MATDLLQQATDALKRGDKMQARTLLGRLLSNDPNNENAWYYYAAAQDDSERQREYLHRVLKINPDHTRAKEVLARMDAQGATATTAPAAASMPSEEPAVAAASPRPSRVRPLNERVGNIAGAAAEGEGSFVIPMNIPGAPPTVSFQALFRDGVALLMRGIDVLQRKPNVYEEEVAAATWWRFWLLVGFTVVVAAALSLFGGVLRSIFWRVNFFAAISGALLYIPLMLGIIYGGVSLSYWWAKRQGGDAPLYRHAMTVALPWMPALLGAAVASALLGVLLGFFAALVTLALEIYALYVMGFGFEALYRFNDPNQKWYTVLMFFVGVMITGIILSILFAPLLAVGLLF